MGFNWNDVIALEPDEVGLYQQQKQFTLNQPHPDGTLFVDQKTNEYFVIDSGKKRPILSPAIAATYSKQKAVVADQQSLNTSVSCVVSAQIFTKNTYDCSAPLQEINSFPGSYYQVDAKFPMTAKITQLNVTENHFPTSRIH